MRKAICFSSFSLVSRGGLWKFWRKVEKYWGEIILIDDKLWSKFHQWLILSSMHRTWILFFTILTLQPSVSVFLICLQFSLGGFRSYCFLFRSLSVESFRPTLRNIWNCFFCLISCSHAQINCLQIQNISVIR